MSIASDIYIILVTNYDFANINVSVIKQNMYITNCMTNVTKNTHFSEDIGTWT